MKLVAGFELIKEKEYYPNHFICIGAHRTAGIWSTYERIGKEDYRNGRYFGRKDMAMNDYNKRLARLLEDES